MVVQQGQMEFERKLKQPVRLEAQQVQWKTMNSRQRHHPL